MSDIIRKAIKDIPSSAGVYIFKDAEGNILYIGKAKDLKKRLSSYLRPCLEPRRQAMLEKIADLQCRLTSSESQAQLLEAALIKQHQPPYNVDLKDDKSFPWIKITNEEFPMVSICRRRKKEDESSARLFGPYPNVKLLRTALSTLRRIFGFRSCRKMPKKMCLYGRLGLCPGPCAGKIGAEDYQHLIEEIVLFLEGRPEVLIEEITKEMFSLAKQKRYEEAAVLRDRIQAIGLLQTQTPFFDTLMVIKNRLGLRRIPVRIEAFDVSNIQGKYATAAMVSFYQGRPDKDNYRRFRIKGVNKIDDYAMLKEVLQRRYRRLLKEGLPLPDLVVVDGGKGHLAVASAELEALGLNDIDIIALAKGQDTVYTKRSKKGIVLGYEVGGFNLLRYVRDEAHRFAIKYHHLLRKKGAFAQ